MEPMETGTILRVRCVDGPCEGLQFMSLDTGRIVFNNSPTAAHAIYRIREDDLTSMTPGTYPVAHYAGSFVAGPRGSADLSVS